VSYSGSEPVDITVYVNTDPFDGSVKRFNTSIGALGASVTAMHAAQCAAILKTAKEVSASLINGFFGTINTELSQQIQALDSAIKAGFGLIQQQSKAVSEKKNTMEGDYNRISSRYVRLFDDLDNECYKRIYALDNQSFYMAEKVQKRLLSESLNDTAAMNLLSIEEISSSQTLVHISSLYRKAADVLKTLHEYITQESSIDLLIDTFLLKEETGENVPVYIPVIWSESDMLESASANCECFIPVEINQHGKQAITEKVNSFCKGASSEWGTLEETESAAMKQSDAASETHSSRNAKEALNRSFIALCEKSFTDVADETEQRIYRTMLSLWNNAQISTL
jgi:hypothetical protein